MDSDWSLADLPTGITDVAQKEREKFIKRYRQYIDVAQAVSLTILVWGPSPLSPSPVSRKRRDIREKFLSMGHNAMFSEDMPDVDGADTLSEKAKEFAQARAAHLICILVEDSPGALAEAHDFCNHPHIAPKVYVLIPEKYKSGYSANGAIRDLENAYGNVFWYQEGDIDSCKVLTKTVVRADALRSILARHGGDLE